METRSLNEDPPHKRLATPEFRISLLLTASVSVNPGLSSVSANNSQQREDEYAYNLRYELEHHPLVSNIVFAENSNWPLSRFEDICAKQSGQKTVELLQLSCNDFSPHLGKGYGESLLIDRALSSSRSLSESDWIVKLTGRQRVTNLSQLLNRIPRTAVFACDLRDHRIYERLRIPAAGHFCDTRMFVLTRAFFDRELRWLYKEHRGTYEYNQEDTYYRKIKSLSNPRVLVRFPIEPHFRGWAGHWHKNYGGAPERAKQLIRGFLRATFPRLYV